MRSLLTVCAALAAVTFIATAPARADMVHSQGGPMMEGKMCWASTNNDLGYGYWRECPKPERAMRMKKK